MKKLNKLFYLKAIGQPFVPLITVIYANYAILGSFDFTKNEVMTALALYAPTIAMALVGSVMSHIAYGKKKLGSAIKKDMKNVEKAIKKLEKELIIYIALEYKRVALTLQSLDWATIKTKVYNKTTGNADWQTIFANNKREYKNAEELSNYLWPILKKYVIGGSRYEEA